MLDCYRTIKNINISSYVVFLYYWGHLYNKDKTEELYIYSFLGLYTVLRVNEYTPLKSNILNNISMNTNIFQNVDKTKFNITSV